MSGRTDAIRFLISGREPSDPYVLIRLLLDELEAQQNLIMDLKRVGDSHYQRQADAITRLGKEIDRLKGVHGA